MPKFATYLFATNGVWKFGLKQMTAFVLLLLATLRIAQSEELAPNTLLLGDALALLLLPLHPTHSTKTFHHLYK